MNIKYKIGKASQDELYNLLVNCDKYFIPKLSQKINIKDYSEKLFNNAVNFEAWHSDKLIGLVSMYINYDETPFGFITNVCIDNEYKKMGIASTLIKACIEYSKNKNISTIKLEVNEENYNAIKLYNSLNFNTYEVTKLSKFMCLELNIKENNV